MFAAYASDAATAAHASDPWYLSAAVWVAVGFLIFFALIGKRAYRLIVVALDERAERIRARLDEAERLARDAEAMVATYRAKQQEAAGEAAAIVENAKREVDRLQVQAAADLQRAISRREAMAMERIAQAEAEAVAEVRSRAVDIAMAATGNILAGGLPAAEANRLIDDAIAELPNKLH